MEFTGGCITMRAFDTAQKLHEGNQVIRSFWEASTLMVYTTLKKEVGWEASSLAYMSLKHGSYVAKIIVK
ncbi:hypothetical protein FCULG_00005840 [Fusarium culmorum]|uniref:Uncharacterized protein n=1 Tax=Fusarium culmorum TaxID=5516 RepID=A0A2T4GWI3_FUSCU|nr:hypothetical protein FCULG_00005840 [Fusarium culmorum]